MADNVRNLIAGLDNERIALKRLIDRLPLGICLVTPNGKIAYYNPNVGPKEKKLCASLLNERGNPNTAENRNAHEIDVEFEDEWYRVRRTTCPSDSGDSVLLIIENLSETRRLEEEIRRSSYLASVGEMAAGVAHEIRNPLTVIKGYLQLLTEKREDAKLSDVKIDLNVMLDEISRLGKIIQEFLNLAKPKDFSKVRVNLNELLTGLREFMESEARRMDVRMSIKLAADKNTIEGDPDSLKQVVLNLITNAFQATGPNGEVTVLTYQRNRYAFLEVADNGPGIPQELKEKVFVPFFSTKPVGTGIGLAISRCIILDHGGSLTFSSKPGNTRFIVQLPLVEAPEEQDLAVLEQKTSPITGLQVL